MAIIHKLLPDGGFVCGDTVSRMTSYAYPSSKHATDAKKHPDRVAKKMVGAESLSIHSQTFAQEYDARNWAKLETLT